MLTNYGGDLDEWHSYDSLNEEDYRKSMSLILGEISEIFPQTNHMFLNNRDVQRQEGRIYFVFFERTIALSY